MQELFVPASLFDSMCVKIYFATESTSAITVSATALSAPIVSTTVVSADLASLVQPQLHDAKVQATIITNKILKIVVFIINSPF